MKQEPVVWAYQFKLEPLVFSRTKQDWAEKQKEWKELPLYTAPKELSDDEILDCVDDCFGLMALQHKYTYDIDQVQEYGLKLAKAILLKASTK